MDRSVRVLFVLACLVMMGAWGPVIVASPDIGPMEDRSTGPLVYSTFFGGSDVDYGSDAVVNANGEMIVVGFTQSDDLPVTPNAPQGTYGGGTDAYVAVLSPDGSALRFCTYLGGAGDEDCSSVVTDATGNIYVCGITDSSDFPTTTGCYQSDVAGGYDAFIAKIDPATGRLVYSTLFGGSDDDGEWSEGAHSVTIQVDATSRVWLSGITYSDDLPTTSGCLQGPGRRP